MKAYLIFVVYVALLGVAAEASRFSSKQWMLFKSKYGKSYENQAEEARRFANFMATKQRVERHNERGDSSYKMGLNHLADWTQEELAQLNGLKLDKRTLAMAQENKAGDREAYLAKILGSSSDPVPDELDWRQVPGRVSPVKDQGFCGSCWAFSAIGGLEGQELGHAFNKSSQFVQLSKQELVDCSTSNQGCNGGLMWTAYDDVKTIGGIMSEDDYPYKARDRECVFKKEKKVMTDDGFAMLPSNDETKLKEVLAKFGPVPIGVAATDNLVNYKSGVFVDPDCESDEEHNNHGVLLVGYGTDPEQGDYWIIKNSWGEDWGDKGYFKIKRGINMCGVALCPSIPKF